MSGGTFAILGAHLVQECAAILIIPDGMNRTVATRTISYDKALELYEAARFVDAYILTETLWSDPGNAQQLDTRETILAARLASRLGSAKFARALFDLAYKRDATNPMVRYYCRTRANSRTLFEGLEDFEQNPELATDDSELKASWFASHASSFALLRDFDSAEHWIHRAYQQNSPSGWVEACHSEILLRRDLRKEALERAESAWAKQPGMPYTAGALAAALAENDRSEEAEARLKEWIIAGGQSFEVLLMLLHYMQQSAERGEASRRAACAQELMALAARFEGLAPLADRFARRAHTYHMLEAARLGGDRAMLCKLAADLDAPFYNAIVKNLAQNPDGRRVLLAHKPQRQDHNTCLPASVCTVLSTFMPAPDQKELAAQLTFEGTPGWRVNDWAASRALTIRHFIADRRSVEALIAAGMPFILGMEGHNNAHATAVVGADFAMGTLLIHDPSFLGLSEKLLAHLDMGEAPLGPRCAVIYPQTHGKTGDAITLNGEEGARLFNEYQRIHEQRGPVAAAELIEGAKLGNTPLEEYLRAIALSARGLAHEALAIMRRLFERWPDCILLQRAVISGTAALGNTGLLRETLGRILSRSPLPGSGGGADYIYPAPHLYARYANLLRRSAGGIAEAERKLRHGLRRGPFEAEAYAVLGDLRWDMGDFKKALLPYRLAASLHHEQDSYARAYADTLHKLGREREAADWLRRRARHFSAKLDASGPYRALVEALESFGFPNEALDALREGLRDRPQDGNLAAFAAVFFPRYARLEEARAALEVARRFAPSGEVHNATAALATIDGELEIAVKHARERVANEPHSIAARAHLLHLTEQLKGPEEALKLCEQWVEEHPGDEIYEELLLDRLGNITHRERRLKILNARLKRNDLDAWAWRELAFTLLANTTTATATRRIEAMRELERAADHCLQTSPDHQATAMIVAELEMVRGRREQAFEACARALQIEPAFGFACSRMFEIAAQLGLKFSKKAADHADAALARTAGQWTLAPQIADWLGQQLGVDEARNRVSRWLRRARRDPYPVSAWAELLLYHGRGVPDARRVLRRLKRAIARFPLHLDLRYALAHAYSNLQRQEEEVQTLREIVANAPHEMRARVYLAETLEELGRFDESEAELIRASEINPLEFRVWSGLSEFYARRGRNEDAVGVLAQACEKTPDLMRLWERRCELLGNMGRADEALTVAREVARRFPRASQAQIILARVLRHPMVRARRQEIEVQYEKAIKLNAQFFEAVDEFTEFLCTHAQFERARQLVERHQPLAEDPVPYSAKLAEILRREGRAKDALHAVQEIVQSRPDYFWGWHLLLQWCTEDKQWQVGRNMLQEAPASLSDNLQFQSRKLEFLEQAGVPREETERGWRELLASFPRSRDLHLTRFDRLLQENRVADAEAVIKAYAKVEPDSPQTLCRQVEIACAQNQKTAALAIARRLWFETQGEIAPSCFKAIQALENAKYHNENMADVNSQIEGGRLPALEAARSLVIRAGKTNLGRETERMAVLLEPRALEYGSWDLYSSVLDAQIDCSHAAWVIGFRSRHEQECHQDTLLWMAVGRALNNLGRHQETVEWLRNWRERAGCEMWSLSNLVYSLLALGRFDEAVISAQNVLNELHHDHAAAFIGEGLLVAHILRGAPLDFMQDYQDLHVVLQRDESKRDTTRAIELYAQLQRSEQSALPGLDAKFRQLLVRSDLVQQTALARAWKKMLYSKMTWPQKIWHFLTTTRLT